jgi:predicted RecA/RadA family phage recombinase
MKNFLQPGDVLTAPTASGAEAGDPMVIGNHLPVVLCGDASTTSPYNAECATTGVFDLSVKAHDGLTNVAMSYGDAVYYHSGETPVLNADDSGTKFGILVEAGGLASGTTATVAVMLQGDGSTPDATS